MPFYVKLEKIDNFMCLLEFECAKRLRAHSQAIPAVWNLVVFMSSWLWYYLDMNLPVDADQYDCQLATHCLWHGRNCLNFNVIGEWVLIHTMQCHYGMVNFLQIPYNRRSIARLTSWSMECLLWVPNLIWSSVTAIWYIWSWSNCPWLDRTQFVEFCMFCEI